MLPRVSARGSLRQENSDLKASIEILREEFELSQARVSSLCAAAESLRQHLSERISQERSKEIFALDRVVQRQRASESASTASLRSLATENAIPRSSLETLHQRALDIVYSVYSETCDNGGVQSITK